MRRSGDLPKVLVGSALGLGLLPLAPGSFGALIGVGYHVGIAMLLAPAWQLPALVAGLVLVAAANHWLTPWAVAYWKNEDPSEFVLDEVAGYLVVPILFRGGELWDVVLWGFVLFRVFDIVKIPPARQIDREVHGSWGILGDDLVSGAYAALVLYGARHFGLLTP